MKCVELNAARKVFEFLMHNVKPSSSSVRAMNAQIVKEKMTEDGAVHDIYEIAAGQANSIQASVMFLSNISMNPLGAEHILGKDQQKGAILDNLFGMFSFFKTTEMFDFVANIYANVSSSKPGRCWMIENVSTLTSILSNLDDVNSSKHRMKHLIETVRNICFEYEKYEKDFQQFNLIMRICKVLVKEHGLTEHTLPSSWEHCNGIANKELYLKDIEKENSRNLLDSLVLLANSKTLLEEMDKIRIYDMLKCLKVPTFGESQDKIDCINAQICSLGMPDIPEVEDAA